MTKGTIRRATPADESAIDDLMSKADRLAVQVPWSDVRSAWGVYDLFLVEADGQLGCVWGTLVGPDTVAQIRVFALLDDWSVHETLAVLLPHVKQGLHEKGVKTLAFIGVESWLLDGLKANGFRQVNTIVAMQKTDFDIPDPGHSRVIVRPASANDSVDILEIDESVFEPLWRNTAGTLAKYLADCAHFCVAELDGKVVGYQCLSLVGRHGHVTRIAVHPRHYGQRIGVRLLAEAMVFFRRKHVFGVTLNTQQDNHRARRVYEWFGFKLLGKEAQVLVLDV